MFAKNSNFFTFQLLSKSLLLSLVFYTQSSVCAPANVDETADIVKLLEHARASLQSVETFVDGLGSLELVVAQPEVLVALRFNNSRNTSTTVTKLNLPGKIMTICKEVHCFYKKHSVALSNCSERISDMLSMLGDLWSTSSTSELLKKQNLITWANEVHKKERLTKESVAKKTIAEQPPANITAAVMQHQSTPFAMSRSKNPEPVNNVLESAFCTVAVKRSPTRRKKGAQVSDKPAASTPVTIKASDRKAIKKSDASSASAPLPWMAPRQSSSVSSVTSKEAVRSGSSNNTGAAKTTTRKKTGTSETAKFVRDTNALQGAKATATTTTTQPNPKNEKKTAPGSLTGSNRR